MAASKIHTQTLAGLKSSPVIWILTFVTILSGVFQAFGAHTVNLAWDASADSSVTGYKVYYGTSQATLATSSSVDVGANLSASIPNLGSGTYYFAATSYNSSLVESDLSNVTSTNLLDAPVILTQPTSLTRSTSTNALFSVTANGGPPLNYQWLKNGAPFADSGNVVGSTTASMTVISVQASDAATYQCVVTNSSGSATSFAATLTVVDPPAILGQPSSQTINSGSPAFFSVNASGTAPFTYAWKKNGSPLADGGNISGSATGGLTVSGVSSTDGGSYTVVVANSIGSATSVSAVLFVQLPPSITSQPANVTTNMGASARFTIIAQGNGYPLAYSWLKNGIQLSNGGNVSGATSSTLSLINLASGDGGSYQCVAATAVDKTTSSVATLTVLVPPGLSSQPTNLTLNGGGLAVFSVTATGTAPLSYSWLRNGSPLSNNGRISGATTANLAITNLTATDAGSYSIVVTNAAGSVTSSAATLLVIAPPAISSQPSNVTSNVGSSVTLTVVAQGQGSLSYQWLKNGSPLTDGGNVSGSTATILNLTGIANGDAGSYQCIVTNGSGSVTSTAATLTVIVPPTIGSQPLSQTLNIGAFAVFNTSASGTAPLTYLWSKNGIPLANGGRISGATSANLTIANVAGVDAGNYSVSVTNVGGTATSASAVLVVITPPTLSSQPANVIVNVGSNAVFNISAQGSAPFSYQWLKNGAASVDVGNVTGSKTPSLTVSTVSGSDAASYQCVVTNSAGSVTSTAATLTAIVPPAITSQPLSQTLNAGVIAVFNASVSGTAPLAYIWSKNGNPLANGGNVSGASSPNLTMANISSADGGNYTVVVSNSAGTATSASALLVVTAPPSIISQPANVTTNVGSPASFTIAAQGPTPLSYQWLKNGSPLTDGGNIAGSTAATLNLFGIASGDAGSYRCVVSNSAGSVTSTTATLTAIVPPAISSQPSPQTLNTGAIAVFNASASGTAPLAYFWSKNGVPLANGGRVSGATSGSLTITNVASADTGSYRVTVTNFGGSAISADAALTVITPPIFTSQPASATANAASLVTFNVTAIGSQPLSYQWTRLGAAVTNNANISGATTASLTVVSVAAVNAGSYQCVATNSAGSATSGMATLTVLLPPSITTQPKTQTLNVGATGVLSVAVSGTAPFTYSWSKDGVALANFGNVSGANTANLTVAGIAHTDSGNYSCVVSNNIGSATSTAATVTVSDASIIITQPTNQTLNACDTLSLSVTVGGSTTPTYQWIHNGTPVQDATNATYSVIAVARADAGTYSVQVTGDMALRSSNAIVKVADPAFLTEPSDNCVSINSTNIFTAEACGTSLIYQWYFANSGSAIGTSINGETNASLTVGPVTSKNIGQYFCIVTNDSGSITSRVALLGVEVAPTITAQPANQIKTVGSTATFAANANANSQMTFQWAKNGTNISGATDSIYTIASVQINDAGTYRCYVGTELCQSAVLTSSSAGHLSVARDLIRPNVTFSYPTLNARFTNSYATHFGTITSTVPQIVISGSATDNSRVAGLTITRTFPSNAAMKIVPNLVGTLNSWRWTNAVSLVAGTNTFTAIVTDAAGWSSTNTLNLFLRVPSTLHVSTTGAGSTVALLPFTFGTATNTATLEIGRNYRISAKPAIGNVFSNWVNGSGAELSGDPTFVFRMSDNLQLTANFVTNPVVANNANGSYNGLFYETNGVRVKSAGAIFNLLVRADATFSGTLKVDGSSYLLSDAFDVHGNATKHMLRSGKTALTVALHLDFVAKQMTGTIASPAPDEWTSVLMADIAPYSSANRFPDSARYTLAISPGGGAPTYSPGGFGYGFVTNTPLGIISFIGTLGDGTPISQTVPISQQGYWPLYIPLYGNRGLIEGWLNFSGGGPGGNVSWIRPAGTLTATYTNGFTNVTQLFGSPYMPVTPSLNPADAALDIGIPQLTFPYAVSNNNAIVKLPGGPTNYLAGSISAPTGSATVTYRPTGAPGNLTGHGAVLQWNNGGYGYVMSNNVSLPLHLH